MAVDRVKLVSIRMFKNMSTVLFFFIFAFSIELTVKMFNKIADDGFNTLEATCWSTVSFGSNANAILSHGSNFGTEKFSIQ